MPIIIEDGRGSGISAGVNLDNRLLTKAISSTTLEDASFDGFSYSVDIGTVTLTTAGESGLLSIKNTDPNLMLQISSVVFGIGKSNIAGDVIIKGYSNVTTGTLISGGSSVTPTNRNYGLSTPAIATVLKGSEGSTITNGTQSATFIVQSPSALEVDSTVVLPNGYSIALSVTPPSGNTSMKVSILARIFYFNPKST